MLVLCWDIDGTLLTTGRAGIFAWEDAVHFVLDLRVDLSGMNTSGLTDIEIAESLVATHRPGSGSDISRRLLRHYEERLPVRLPLRKGQVLPGVLEVLNYFHERPGVLTMLLTGNTRAGAKAKLTHYALDGYFSLGAFADDGPGDRLCVARKAWEIALREAGPGIRPEHVFVIGDTPHDIRCGKEIGARTVAVASGTYTQEQLSAYGPWWVVERMPSPEIFAQKIKAAVPHEALPPSKAPRWPA